MIFPCIHMQVALCIYGVLFARLLFLLVIWENKKNSKFRRLTFKNMKKMPSSDISSTTPGVCRFMN